MVINYIVNIVMTMHYGEINLNLKNLTNYKPYLPDNEYEICIFDWLYLLWLKTQNVYDRTSRSLPLEIHCSPEYIHVYLPQTDLSLRLILPRTSIGSSVSMCSMEPQTTARVG